jgi:hypothetical protein
MEAKAKKHGKYWLPVVLVHLPDGKTVTHVGDQSCPHLYRKDAIRFARLAIAESKQYGFVVRF